MGASAPVAISGVRRPRNTRVDHPSITSRCSSTMPQPRCGTSTIGSCRRSNPDNTARPPGARARARSAASTANGRARIFDRIKSYRDFRSARSRYPCALRTCTSFATPLRATLWRATLMAPASMSPASSLRRNSFAAAIARIPVPVPTSRRLRKRCRRASCSSAIKQPLVDGCSPVPNAVAASTAIPMAPAGTPPP